jgi:hypothetical protein
MPPGFSEKYELKPQKGLTIHPPQQLKLRLRISSVSEDKNNQS